jgi:F-type H+-transporting ATPase subunit gamma
MITIGRKGSDYFGKRGYNILASYDSLLDSLSYEKSSEVAEGLMRAFTGKQFDRVLVIYNQFKNAAVQQVKVEQLMPVELPKGENEVPEIRTDYIFQPTKDEIVTELIPRSLKIQFYKSLLDSLASEHGARMTAMHQATDNAGELIKELNLTYNKARQAAITKEILEIVSGAEALKNQ